MIVTEPAPGPNCCLACTSASALADDALYALTKSTICFPVLPLWAMHSYVFIKISFNYILGFISKGAERSSILYFPAKADALSAFCNEVSTTSYSPKKLTIFARPN